MSFSRDSFTAGTVYVNGIGLVGHMLPYLSRMSGEFNFALNFDSAT